MYAKESAKKRAIAKNVARRKYAERARYPVYRGISGYGDYEGEKKAAKKAVAKQPAAAPPGQKWVLADDYGASVGEDIGRGLGKLVQGVGRIFGFGDYNVSHNSVWAQMKGLDPPIMKNSHGKSVIIRHREFLGDVSTSTAFTIQDTIPLNPGMPESFPWLAGIASNFEKYRWRGLVFEFKSTSVDALNSTNTALGSMVMMTQYDCVAPAPVNKQEMEQHDYASSTKPSCSAMHPVECKMSLSNMKEWFVRNGPVPNGADQHQYDLGTFYLASVGNQASPVVGELWASYEVEFYQAHMPQSLDQGGAFTDHWQLKSVTNSAPLGTTSTLQNFSNIGTTINTAGTTVTFPANVQEGTFALFYDVIGSSTAVVAPSLSLTNCVGVKIMSNDGIAGFSNSSSTTGNFMLFEVISITGPGAQLVFGTGGTLPASPTASDFLIMQINAEITT